MRKIGLLILAAACSTAMASFTYPKGTVSVKNGPVSIQGKEGALTLINGPVEITIDSYTLINLWGDGSGALKIKSTAGTVTVPIAKKNFSEAWKFLEPANGLNPNLSIQGFDSDEVVVGKTYEQVINCQVPAIPFAVSDNNGKPITTTTNVPVPNQPGQTNKVTSQLQIYLCAQVVNGNIDIRQTFNTNCNGSQKVRKESGTRTEVFTVVFRNPATNEEVAKIHATASEYPFDTVKENLSACQ